MRMFHWSVQDFFLFLKMTFLVNQWKINKQIPNLVDLDILWIWILILVSKHATFMYKTI